MVLRCSWVGAFCGLGLVAMFRDMASGRHDDDVVQREEAKERAEGKFDYDPPAVRLEKLEAPLARAARRMGCTRRSPKCSNPFPRADG